ncbi:RNA polymerase III subunit E isoform X1 [Tachypleus tridentatus]|uniref:RNA polymerase III subunit E isoform X1 n=1 Tax=Tachypleus tridentatus TaxID=6853 RepID=UPI003FD352BD
MWVIQHVVDVYLSKALSENLYLFQYPVRPSTTTYDNIDHLKARIKPKQQKVELELKVNTHSPNYDFSKGEQIALNVDGKIPGESAFFQSSLMDKQILSSSKVVTSTSPYAVGLLRQGELHLTPLHAIVQLRPAFPYLDHSDAKARVDSNHPGDEGSQDEEEEAKAVTVRFAGIETEKIKQARERSYSYHQQQMASEPWTNVNFHNLGSNLSDIEAMMLQCPQMDQDISSLPGTPDEYLKILLPFAKEKSTISQGSRAMLRKSPLPDQVKHLAVSAKVIQFSSLLELLPLNVDPLVVLRSLQQVAVLVQGCWVVKSDLLYPKDTCSPLTGVSAEILSRARDYIMWKYTQKRYVVRKEILSVIKLPDDDLLHIMEQLGKRTCTRGWKFLLPFDQHFIENFPDVFQRQQMLWEARWLQLSRVLSLTCQESKEEVPASPKLPRPKQRRRTKSHRSSTSDDNEGSGPDGPMETKKEPKSPIKGLGIMGSPKPKKPPWSPQKVTNGPIQSPVNLNVNRATTSKIINGPPHPRMATFEISPTTSSFMLSPELKEELFRLTREKLQDQLCVSLSDLHQFLDLKTSGSHVSSSSVSLELLEEAVVAVGGRRLQNKWPQNMTPEPLFVFTHFGDHLDRIREVLVEAFATTARLRPGMLQKEIEDQLGESLSEGECKTLLKNYCIFKSGFYYLKGTVNPDS